MVVREWLVWAGVGLLTLLVSCTPQAASNDDTAGGVNRALSALVLHPERTCEELCREFEISELAPIEAPDEAGYAYVEHAVPTLDGEVLRVWHMPVERPRGTVIITPGAAGPMSCYLHTAKLLIDRGWEVVMFDYRGFGGSSGKPSLRAMRDDLDTVVTWTINTFGCDCVTLFGVSLGSVPVLAEAVYRPHAINAVVLDSPVALRAQIARLRNMFGREPEALLKLLDPTLISEDAAARLLQPLLVYLHGRDNVTPPETVERIYRLASGPKQLVRFEELHHARGQFFETDVFASRLDGFLASVWRQ